MNKKLYAFVALTSSVASSALAQTAPEPATNEQPAPAQSGTLASDGPTLEDIVVTATRRSERLQEVPVTVTAITAASAKGAGLVDLRNLTQVVPGFFGGRSSSVFQPNIRGVGSTGTSIGDESNVATYVDGVYQGDGFASLNDIVEVDRIEVLRGPQGTVFGRNATGGLINILTKDPSFDTQFKVAAKVGRLRNDAGDYDARGYVSTGLTSTLAMDTSLLYRKTEDYVKELSRGGEFGGIAVFDVRSKLLFQPSSRAKFVLMGEYTRMTSSTNTFQPYKGNIAGARFGAIVPTEPYTIAVDVDPKINTRRYNTSFRAQIEFDGFNLETTTGYSHNTTVQVTDSDSSTIFFASFLGEYPGLTTEIFSQEIRLLSSGSGKFKWTAGVYGFDLNGISGFRLTSTQSPTVAPSNTLYQPDLHTRSYAGFAEGTYEPLPDLFVTLGGRYSWEERTFQQVVNGKTLFASPAETSFDRFTYRAALRYNFARNANVYASIGTGFKSGVFNFTSQSPAATKPEKITAYEGGIKADPFSWLRTNLSFFYYDYKDLQVNARDANGSGYILQNAATAEIYGSELEVTIAPTNNLNIRSSAAYNHGRYESFPAAQVFLPIAGGGNTIATRDVSGNQLVRAPRVTLSTAVDWSHDLADGKFNVSGNIFYSEKVYFDFLNNIFQKRYAIASGEVSWTDPSKHWTFSIWAQNITDAKVFREMRPGAFGTDLTYEMPRRVGLGIQYKY